MNPPLDFGPEPSAPLVAPLTAVNDFVIKFANVNGSGSASANELFAKSILRMGVPVSPRNIFPSNIQGLPTWYEVRVCEEGWLGRRGGVGGYLFYDSSRPMPTSRFRGDLGIIGMPITEICNRTYNDSRQRQLFKNIIYVGARAHLAATCSHAAESVRINPLTRARANV